MLSLYSPTIQLPPTPDGLDQITHKIYWSEELSGYIEEFIGSVNIFGAGYNVLRSMFMAGGNQVVPVVLVGFDGREHSANIVINDIVWNPITRVARCEFVESGYLSLIDINADVECTLNTRLTKSAVPMMGNMVTGLTYVLPDGTVFANDRVGVPVFDAINTVVQFISDGQLSVFSNYFNSGDTYPVLISGKELRTGGAAISPQNGAYFATISFADLFNDIARHFCVTFTPQDGGIRVEPRTFFKSQVNGITIGSVKDAEAIQTVIAATFYAKITFGGDVDEDYNFLPQLRFIGFDEEEYHVSGQANNRSGLDLSLSKIIVDTNAIQQVIEYGNTGTVNTMYDEKVFMVWHHRITGLPVLTPNPINPSNFYYNEPSSNSAVANRWFGSVPFSVYAFLGFGNNEANAVLQVQTIPSWWFSSLWRVAILTFPNTSVLPAYDPLGNMAQINGGPYDVTFFDIPTIISSSYTGDGTFYIVPVSGVYTVNVNLYYSTANVNPVFIYVVVYDSTDVLLQFHEVLPGQQHLNPGFGVTPAIYNTVGSITVAAASTDKICIVMWAATLELRVNPNGAYINTFTVEDTFTTSKTYNESTAEMVNTEVAVSLDDEKWAEFATDPHKLISINLPDGVVKGYLRTFERNTTDQLGKLSVDSSFNMIHP